MTTRSIARALSGLCGLSLLACFADDPAGPSRTPVPPGPAGQGPVFSFADACGEQTFDLLAGQSIVVGAVTIANDEDLLYVRFQTMNGWVMSDTRVAVTTNPNDIPRIGGQVAPGRFPVGAEHDPAVTQHTHEIPLSVLGGESAAVVAAYAEVENGPSMEGAWIEGDQIRQRGSWASFAAYELADCDAGGEVSEVVGPAGGALEIGDIALIIPAGAVDSDVEFTVSLITDGLPDDVRGPAVEILPEGGSFDPPLTLVLPYDDTGLSGDEERNLSIQQLREDGGRDWRESIVDEVANTVTTELEHLSVYAVVPTVLAMRLRATPETVAGEESLLGHVVSIRNLGTSAIPGGEVTIDLTIEGPAEDVPSGYSTSLCSREFDPAVPTIRRYTCTLFADPQPGGPAIALDFRHRVPIGSAGETLAATATFSYDMWTGGGGVSTDLVAPIETDFSPAVEHPPADFETNVAGSLNIFVVNEGPHEAVYAEFQVDLSGALVPGEIVAPCAFVHPLDSNDDGIDDGASFHCLIETPLPPLASASFQFTVTPRAGFAEDAVNVFVAISRILGTTDPDPGNNFAFASFPVLSSP